MKLKQLSLFIENKPGALSHPCKVLADAGFSIRSLSLADTSMFGVLRLIIEDWMNAKSLLESKGFSVNVTDVVAVEVDDTPGMLAGILQIFDAQCINVEYMYAFPRTLSEKATLIFRFDDPDAAISKLKENNTIRLLDGKSVFF